MKHEELNNYKDQSKEAFTVPEGYFDYKKMELLKIPTDQKEPTVVPLWKRSWIMSSSIAAILILGLFFIFTPFEDQNSEDPINLNELTNTQIEEYLLDEYLYGFTDDNMMIEELDFTEMEENL